MSKIWDTLINGKDHIIELFNEYCTEIEEPGLSAFNQPDNGWINRVWSNTDVRRAHIDVVDARDTKGLWMMHVCVFPQLNNKGPIYGFDVIAGKNKMTGAFHDFSPLFGADAGYDDNLTDWYYNEVESFIPSKKRTLPEWAQNIFSSSMIAAGNVTDLNEAERIVRLAVNNLKVYFEAIGDCEHTEDTDWVREGQNYYAHNQQQNPHTPNVMKSLGLNEADVERFCTDMLFPKV